MREGDMRMTTDAERALAQAMHDALSPVMRGRDLGEAINALTALLVEAIEQYPDSRAAAESVCEGIRANFPHG
jgi:hypothetical protein